MKRAIVAVLAAALTVTGCASKHADPAACKTALRAEYEATGNKSIVPAACKGIPAKKLQQFAKEIISGH
jgi:hypothetical protein